VVAPPPLVFLAGLGAGLALDAVLPSFSLPDALALAGGLCLLLAGAALLASFVARFRRAGTDVRPDRPTTAIVTDGPYRFTRNPGYLGMAAAYAGIALLAQAPWALVTLVPVLLVIDRGVIAREERDLAGKFGEPYVQYMRRVRRWV
jgi:protein-S-isoprenylcysteine O-methyltransferase Ste14